MTTAPRAFFGWHVVAATFVLATFGWGIGFYGPPIYLHAVVERTGWSVALVSWAVTAHFLFGVPVVSALPRLYKRHGIARVTCVGSILLALGVVGWARANTPWQLFAAAALSGSGWVTMGAAAVNALIAPWFVRTRPKALATAYNGASIGGVVFAPLWVSAIALLGFPGAAIAIGCSAVAAMLALSYFVFSQTPERMGQVPDGDETAPLRADSLNPSQSERSTREIVRDRHFQTLAAGMALSLFAQIGVLAHLYSVLVPNIGKQAAGFAMGFATACAIVGRTVIGWTMPPAANRRHYAAMNLLVQILGALAILAAQGKNMPLMLIGIALIGAGIGNVTSLPPLIAQVEFSKPDVARVVPLIVAIGQASYAFAPAVFGLLRGLEPQVAGQPPSNAALFLAAIAVQIMAIVCFASRHRPIDTSTNS